MALSPSLWSAMCTPVGKPITITSDSIFLSQTSNIGIVTSGLCSRVVVRRVRIRDEHVISAAMSVAIRRYRPVKNVCLEG